MKRIILCLIGITFAIISQATATSGTCGTNARWEFDEWRETLSIEGSGAIRDYSSSSLPPWHQYKDEIKSIYIDEGITEIGKYAFWECEEVDYVDIPLSLERIGMNAFAYCKKLDDITLYNNLTTIEGQAFMECMSLTSIVIPNSVTTMGGSIFAKDTLLSNVVLPNNISTLPRGTFQNCWALTEITIPSSVEQIEEVAFFNTGITDFQLPSNLLSIGARAFKQCENLTSLTIPDKVTEIGYGFVASCHNLQSVTIGKSVQKFKGNTEGCFHYCDNLQEIIFKPITPPTFTGTAHFQYVPSDLHFLVPCGSLSSYQAAYANMNWISTSNFDEDCSSSLPSDGSTLTCAEAADYANQLDHNSPTTQTYTIYGYVTSTDGVISQNQQTFWIADTQNGGNVFEIYWGNVSQLLQVGDYVKCVGHLMRFYSTPEMKNPNVTLVYRSTNNAGSTIDITPNYVELDYFTQYDDFWLRLFELDDNNNTIQMARYGIPVLSSPQHLVGSYSMGNGTLYSNECAYYNASEGKYIDAIDADINVQYVGEYSKYPVYVFNGSMTLTDGRVININNAQSIVLGTYVNIENNSLVFGDDYELTDGATPIEEVQTESKATKVIRDGQIFILRGEKVYTVTGQKVK